MSRASADIVGSVGALFVAKIDSGTIVQATLGGQNLQIGSDNRSVTITSLVAGDSNIQLALVFAPGDPHANITVGSVTTGTAQAHDPPGVILNTHVADVIELFGE